VFLETAVLMFTPKQLLLIFISLCIGIFISSSIIQVLLKKSTYSVGIYTKEDQKNCSKYFSLPYIRPLPNGYPRLISPETDLKVCIFIPFARGNELLRLAVSSLFPLIDNLTHVIIFDNSDLSILTNQSNNIDFGNMKSKIEIFTPPVPLSFTQTMNSIQQIAYNKECDTFAFMHSDAEINFGHEHLIPALKKKLINKNIEKWGVLFTNYDSLAFFNPEATINTGVWDIRLTQYGSEDDYYYRLNLTGRIVRQIDANISVSHEVSSTFKGNRCAWLLNNHFMFNYEMRTRYLKRKWGSEPLTTINNIGRLSAEPFSNLDLYDGFFAIDYLRISYGIYIGMFIFYFFLLLIHVPLYRRPLYSFDKGDKLT